MKVSVYFQLSTFEFNFKSLSEITDIISMHNPTLSNLDDYPWFLFQVCLLVQYSINPK